MKRFCVRSGKKEKRVRCIYRDWSRALSAPCRMQSAWRRNWTGWSRVPTSLEQNAAKTEALIENGMAKLAEMQAAGQNTEELNALLAALKEAQAERFDQLAEHMHKESVKVYRNVQAVVVDGNAKQEEASGKNASSVSGKLGAVLGISLVALLVSAAGLAFQVLVYLNII